MAKNKDKDPEEMSFLDHLEELRWHLIRIVTAVLLFTVIAFLNKHIIFDIILFGPKNADFITYRLLCQLSHFLGLDETICLTEPSIKLVNTAMAGQFSTHIWVSFIAGIVVAFPYIIWELWRFIKPALYENELKYANGIIFYTSFLFLTGISFGYFIISPLSVSFLGNYSISDQIGDFIDLSSYMSTVTMATLASGILFELPVIIYFLSKLGLVTPAFLRKYRKHAIIVNLILSAIITPPDVSSQALVAVPLLFLYEISIIISARVEKSRAKA